MYTSSIVPNASSFVPPAGGGTDEVMNWALTLQMQRLEGSATETD
jgi:hypothetical protein